jgi:hypothetical protein
LGVFLGTLIVSPNKFIPVTERKNQVSVRSM